MKKLTLLFFVLLMIGMNTVEAQKAKFKNQICTVQQAKLPVHYSEPSERTYNVMAKGKYADGVDVYGKNLYGWEKDTDTPRVTAVVSLYGFQIDSPKRHSEKKQKKDKEGNVTDTWTEYWYTGSSKGYGNLYVYGHDNPFRYEAKPKRKSKAEEEAAAKAEAEKQDLADNPFLAGQAAAPEEEDTESDIGTDQGLESTEKPLVRTINIDRNKTVKTKRYRSISKAYEDYRNNQRPKLVDNRSSYPRQAYRSAMQQLNNMYGFAPVNNRFYLKKMKSEKHPEFQMWNDACQATATLFKNFTYSEPINASQFDPIIEYFANQVNSISENDKKARKHKKFALENLLNILYYLDRHDEVIEWAGQYLNANKLDKLAERMTEKSERLKAHLAFHKMSSCHFETNEVVDADDIETTELAPAEEGEGRK